MSPLVHRESSNRTHKEKAKTITAEPTVESVDQRTYDQAKGTSPINNLILEQWLPQLSAWAWFLGMV